MLPGPAVDARMRRLIAKAFTAPSVPEAVIAALDAKLARAGGLAAAALLAGVVYEGGRRGHLLALLDAADGAEPALARAMNEALVFSGIEAGELDVVFLASTSPVAQAMGPGRPSGSRPGVTIWKVDPPMS